MEIKLNKQDSYTEIIIDGDVDASSAITIDEALEQCLLDKINVLVNCEALEYISSAGLGVFMSYFSDFEDIDKKLVLFGLSGPVYKVFELIGLTALISIVNNKKEAETLLE